MAATEHSHGVARYVHFILRRADGKAFLERWGIEARKVGGIFLHKMDAPDPGIDLHDHPWAFVSIIFGGYTQERLKDWEGVVRAQQWDGRGPVGVVEDKRWLSVMRLNDCHRITRLHRRRVWTIVIHGPHRRDPWGFYMPSGWMDEKTYKAEVRARRGDIVVEGYKSKPVLA